MSSIRPKHRNALSRALMVAIVIAMSVAVLGASGCRWFRKNDVYATSPDQRPLEFPPAFDQTEADRSLATTASGSVTRSSLATLRERTDPHWGRLSTSSHADSCRALSPRPAPWASVSWAIAPRCSRRWARCLPPLPA